MRILFLLLLTLTITTTYTQEALLAPLPINEINTLRTQTSGIEMTIYEGTKTISISGVQNSRFIGFAADTIAPSTLNDKNDAYLMILVNDEFYMDCELSYHPTNPYLIFKKDEKVYYNKISDLGKKYFGQLMNNK